MIKFKPIPKARIILYSILAPIIILTHCSCSSFGRNRLYMDSYIADIDTPGYKNTKQDLELFNSFGNEQIVQYEPVTKWSRPIYIKETKTLEGKKEKIGQALVALDYCTITIEEGLNEYEYYLVLIHEYLHCLGYDHVDDPNDIMYYELTDPSIDNIKKYAKEIEERRKKWMNSKN